MNARLSYREAAVRGASPLRLVVLLYEQAIEDVRRALAAQQRTDIERRTREINHAILVISYLQASLDKKRGGAVAANLEQFYNRVRARLVSAQCMQSGAELEKQLSLLMLVHSAWCKAEQDLGTPSHTPPDSSEPSSPEGAGTLAEWNA